MGGSAVAGEILSMVKDSVVVHWDYHLPANASNADLVICTSWSGDTAETISAYDKARELSIPVAVISTGGKLSEMARRDDKPLVHLPNPLNMPPRCGAGLMIGGLFSLVGAAHELPEIDPANLETAGKTLADAIGDKMPIFYAAYPWRKIAGFFKTTVNENAKRHSWASNFPSAAHNEIMGWSGPYRDSAIPVLIQGGDEASEYRRDEDALVAIVSKMGYNVPKIELPGSSTLQKALSGYVLALWTSFHIANNLGVDPLNQDWIDEFKRLKAMK